MSNQTQAARHYVINGVTFTADPQGQLGAGAEGMVIAHPRDPKLCVKLFHMVDPYDRGGRLVAAYRARKVRHVCEGGYRLPPQFILPQVPVFDSGGHVVGFQMRRVPSGHFKLRELVKSDFRANHQQGLRNVAELFANIFEDLEMIHARGLVVGDVNLGCIMFEPGGDRAWVDTDSWSYPGFPCLPTTELYAHPDLYPNLEAAGTVAPRPEHDRFAFTVAFSQLAIPGAHPFRMGIHPTVSGLQERTSAGITIFDPDVIGLERLGGPEVLSDALLDALVTRLKRRVNTPLDPALLRVFAREVVGCKHCGAQYHGSRKHCPKCQQQTVVSVSAFASYLIEELFATTGTLLFAQLLGPDLYLACRIDDRVQIIRIDQHGVAQMLTPDLPNIPGAQYRFFANCLVVCPEPTRPETTNLELYRLDGNTLNKLDSSSTGVLAGERAVFATSSRFLYRTAANALVRSEPFGASGVLLEKPVTNVYRQQSWFTADRHTGADREVVFGYHRALRTWEWFLVHGDVIGERYHNYEIGDLGLRQGEVVEDFAVYFSASSVLLAMVTSYNGREYARYALIGLDGTVQLNQLITGTDTTFEYWQNPHGKLHQGRSVLHVTPDGIVKQQFSDGSCTTLSGTGGGKVTGDDQLVPLKGRVGIVRRWGISTLTGKK